MSLHYLGSTTPLSIEIVSTTALWYVSLTYLTYQLIGAVAERLGEESGPLVALISLRGAEYSVRRTNSILPRRHHNSNFYQLCRVLTWQLLQVHWETW